jgi:hypothetical protein
MSDALQVIIGVWVSVSALVFLAAALMLDDRNTRDKDRVWIGRIGLAAPLWPLMAVGAVVVILALMGRELFRAARGRG